MNALFPALFDQQLDRCLLVIYLLTYFKDPSDQEDLEANETSQCKEVEKEGDGVPRKSSVMAIAFI